MSAFYPLMCFALAVAANNVYGMVRNADRFSLTINIGFICVGTAYSLFWYSTGKVKQNISWVPAEFTKQA